MEGSVFLEGRRKGEEGEGGCWCLLMLPRDSHISACTKAPFRCHRPPLSVIKRDKRGAVQEWALQPGGCISVAPIHGVDSCFRDVNMLGDISAEAAGTRAHMLTNYWGVTRRPMSDRTRSDRFALC